MWTPTGTSIVACACLLALANARTTAAQPLRSGVDLVALTVTVTDPQGRGIPGLTADRFAVYDEGIQQPVSLFSSGQLPLDIAFVLDTSASMSAILPVVSRGARALLTRLREGDRAAVIDVKGRIEIREELTAHLAGINKSLATLKSTGQTALYDGLYIALHEFERDRRRLPELRRQALVVFSDGMDTASHVRFADLLELARSCGVTIYTLTLQGTLDSALDLTGETQRVAWEMRTLTRETGGVAFFPARPLDLERAFATIATELTTQYALAYPVPAEPGGRTFRRVSIQLVPPAEGVARTRPGYVPSTGRVN